MDSSAEPAGSVLAYARTLTGQLITVSGEVIQRALAQHQGSEPDRPPASDAVSFVLATAATLRCVAGEPAG